jgi:hypothetical protein
MIDDSVVSALPDIQKVNGDGPADEAARLAYRTLMYNAGNGMPCGSTLTVAIDKLMGLLQHWKESAQERERVCRPVPGPYRYKKDEGGNFTVTAEGFVSHKCPIAFVQPVDHVGNGNCVSGPSTAMTAALFAALPELLGLLDRLNDVTSSTTATVEIQTALLTAVAAEVAEDYARLRRRLLEEVSGLPAV